MTVDGGKAKAEGLTSEYRGKTLYFCSKQCKESFDKALEQHAARERENQAKQETHQE
jgi:YHS domain-containing protein